jgi:hypothetical protein
MKAPKCKGGLIRENPRAVPLPRAVSAVLNAVKQTAIDLSPEAFVFEGRKGPLNNNFYGTALKQSLHV